MPFEPKFRFLKIIWRVISFFLGGVCSIQLSYCDMAKFMIKPEENSNLNPI